MSFDGTRQPPQGHERFGLRHQVFPILRSIPTRLAAWQVSHQPRSLPDEVMIGTLRRPPLAIAIRATVVQTETTLPPIREFLKRVVPHPISPYCPRCSLPLEPWQIDHRTGGTPIGYECRPCGTQIRWTPADALDQMQREVRRHDAQDWERYREALQQHEREELTVPVSSGPISPPAVAFAEGGGG